MAVIPKDMQELLALIREKPEMYIGRSSVVRLLLFLDGNSYARHNAGDLAFDDVMIGFQKKVEKRFSINLSINWADILAFAAGSEAKGLDYFWEMCDEHLLNLFAQAK